MKSADELPEQLQTRDGRRVALREARRDLDTEREQEWPEDDPPGGAGSGPDGGLEAEQIVPSGEGRRGWVRGAKQQLDDQRAERSRAIPRAGGERLLEGKRLLEEEHRVLIEANAAYEAYRAGGVMKDGRRFGRPPDPWVAPEIPEGVVNITDPLSEREDPARVHAGLQRAGGRH